MTRATARRRVLRLRGDGRDFRPDALAAEEPLEIRLGGEPLTVTMRTPGQDFDLVAGFLVGEGLVAAGEELAALRYCAGTDADGANTYNVVDATLRDSGRPLPLSAHRNLLTTSACGLCGRDTVDAVRTHVRHPVDEDPLRVPPALLYALPDRLRAVQRTFESTGGLHAAGLFDGRTGELLCAREDVGRHNAVDKVVGWALREGLLPLTGHVLLVSGRASFELTQKAALAGVPLLAAVSAPSSLAADLAEELGLTLVGFLRGEGANVYTRPDRIA
ncbi:formate dehydrogenase accessory sulfurtransferase FdhD [Kitasatospora purpeofusca]|uniref:formate dehydrogenase accessory sulfurtransferase FdhD n=1 Tax=Kitasatospora purpeofusca TaxID=67352 RepID=UPI002E14007E|nr:formate dehydrogenase accessory sulfurtransferase FdhD [Kitasatospora purpeofusca]WSR40769.1 formate dehydrogenase accessory sulfurtransferase FdhD [Kitasatospora purpeofusca]